MNRVILIAIVALVFTACEAGAGLEVPSEDAGSVTADVFGQGDTTPITPPDEDASTNEDTNPVDPADSGAPEPDAPENGCQPGQGCFGEPCSDAQDCLSGICSMHMGAQVCSKTCDAACPDGFSCQIAAGATDGQSICISNYPSLCLPCETSEGCGTDSPQACVRYPGGLSFCGGACDADTPCPNGYDCQQVENTSGVETFQCVNTEGVCTCTELAIDLGMSSPCRVTNEHGSCEGVSACTVDGLGACNALEPSEEVCDGIDNNCDGVIDNVVCDDGNPCTVDTCYGEGGCGHDPLDEGECLDGDACTIGDHCEAGVCVGSPIDCDDENPCTKDSCDGLGGCSFDPVAGPCDDGEICTLGDFCEAGACIAGVTLACDDQNPCTDDACGAQGCINEPNAEPCDDQNACTVSSACVAGACVAQEALGCDDQNSCTIDACDPADGCLHAPHTQPCDDGNICTLGDACSAGACASGGELMACDDLNPCTDDTCDPELGCIHVPNSQACDDGSDCTVMDTCKDGQCLGSGSLECDDENPCTIDVCLPDGGCDHQITLGDCEDGDPCTLGDQCINGGCVAGEALACDDQNPCTDDACDPTLGCVFEPNEADCEDGNACTTADMCWQGDCVAMGNIECDDQNPCTIDSCKPLEGCVNAPVDAACSDGDPCTINDQCSEGACVSGEPLACEDQNPCTAGSCDLGVCSFEQVVGDCDDQNECTADDHCEAGFCVATESVICDDENPCTTNGCEPAVGCVSVNNDNPCSDQNVCTVDDACEDGACASGPSLDCDDGSECTNDACDILEGCVHDNLGDETPCGFDDTTWCQAGQCVAKEYCGDSIVQPGEQCDDGNQIDNDSCSNTCVFSGAVDITFTTCGATGPTGPNEPSCENEYTEPVQTGDSLTVIDGIQYWTVAVSGTYRIEAFGAKGGNDGGNGARMRGDFNLNAGQVLKILVGQQGLKAPAEVGSGGGGGTFVATDSNEPLVIAAGGGGTGHNAAYSNASHSLGQSGESGQPGNLGQAGDGGSAGNGGGASHTTGNGTANGAGGGGFYTDGGSSDAGAGGANGGQAFVNGGVGGNSTGGFGGGGGSDLFIYGCGSSPHGGSGGGGYSGGGAGGNNCNGSGGGGGSFNVGGNPDNATGAHGGDGRVTITLL